MADINKALAVDVKNLTVRFGDFSAVKNVSFQVSRGEIFGFLGANGAGKTTTIRVLCGLLVPSEGEVVVAGESFSESGEIGLKEKVGYMSQKFTLYNDMSVAENLEFASKLRKLDVALYRKRSKELLDFVNFDRKLDVLVRDLPGGIKQQVSLAAALLHDPEVVFLDEPTAGVTPASRARFWSLIQDVASQGKTVFVTTHYMDEAEQCGRVALMRSGELIALDRPENLKRFAFPKGLIELEPTGSASSEVIAQLKSSSVFSLFEPHGMRYHAEIKDNDEWDLLKSQLERQFKITRIKPTLEDVFIRLVEGDTR